MVSVLVLVLLFMQALLLPEMRPELEFVGNKYLLFSMLEGIEIEKTLNE